MSIFSAGLKTPKRRVFFSFDYENDIWRVNQVRNMGALNNTKIVFSNRLEEVKSNREATIRKWINDKMSSCSCVVVLIGTKTSRSKWVKYEIKTAIKNNKGLFGIHIHGLENQNNKITKKGNNPLPSNYNSYEPSIFSVWFGYPTHKWIKDNLKNWVEKAIDQKSRKSNRSKI